MDEERKTNEELLEEILFETTDNFSNQVTGSKEREQEAANVVRLADALTKLRQAETEKVDREERRRIEEAKNNAMCELSLKQAEAEAEDKAERRRIEEEKNQAAIELEEAKKVPFWQSCVEWSVKYILPGCISAIFFDKFQKRTLTFEETGSIRSKASKDLRSGWSFWK